jgi:oligopeptide/dipeptide ABC transporter ATP-binding protein
MTVNDIKVHYEVRNEAGERVPLKAVDGVTFEVHRGQTVGIVGESGCGKSTLGRALVHIEELAGGSIQLGGVQISDLSEREMLQYRRQLQMIFQNPQASLNPRWKIGRSVQEPLRVHDNKSPEEQRASVLEQLDRVGLPYDIVDRYPHHLSGGQQQRVAIARALAASPDLVVCDEPVSALDVSIQAQITNLLVDIQAESGVAYVFIAHDLAVVRSISDVVLIMYLGKIVEKADSEVIFQRPRHPYTLALLSASPIPNAQIERHRDRIILAGDLPDPSNPPSGCRFRTRCSWARDLCTQVEPELRDVGDGHFVACHFHEELADEAIRFLPWVDQ